MGYNTKVYRKQGGEEFVVSAGGKITVEDGGEIELDGKITVGDSGEIDMGAGVVVGIENQSAIADLDAEDEMEDDIT